MFLFSVANLAQEHVAVNIEKITSSQLHFEDLRNSTDIFSFRFWNIGQVIDIRILSDSTRIGTITNFVTECPFTDFKKSQCIYSKRKFDIFSNSKSNRNNAEK